MECILYTSCKDKTKQIKLKPVIQINFRHINILNCSSNVWEPNKNPETHLATRFLYPGGYKFDPHVSGLFTLESFK